MTKIHNGQALRELLFEKNISVTKISELTNRGRQQVHADFNRVKIKDTVLAVYCQVLDVDLKYFSSPKPEPMQEESSYLMDHLRNLEEQFKRVMNQLETKDMQIASLTKMLEMTLGKSKGVIRLKTTPVRKMYPEAGALEA